MRQVIFILLLVQLLNMVYCKEFYYIATNGMDNPGCGDIGTPCMSLNFTLNQASNSDTIYFVEGLYVNQSIVTISLDNISIIGQGNLR